MLGETFQYASQLAESAVSVWFVSWALRLRYELDLELNRSEHIVRWTVIAVSFGLAMLRGPGVGLAVLRIAAGLIGLAFLAWPNLAHHVMSVTTQWRLPKQSSGQF